MRALWRKLVAAVLREFFVISRGEQAKQREAMMIGARTAEEDIRHKLRDQHKVLSHER